MEKVDGDSDSDVEEEKNEDEVAMDFFVQQQRRASESMDLSVRRNTAIDRIVEK